MLSHPNRAVFNIAQCRACGEIRICHTETGVEKQRIGKKQLFPQPFLWRPVNCRTHIKKEPQKKSCQTLKAAEALNKRAEH
jgi:hypothetical protein